MTKPVERWGSKRKWNENVQRSRLADVVPLSTPYAAYIEPTNLCNFRCRFCPTGHPSLLKKVNRPAGLMEFALFQKVIEDFKQFPERLRVLFIHKDGEPLVHPRIGEMLALAKKSDISPVVWLTTNGALLDQEKAVAIIDSGIDFVRLSVEHVTPEGYRSMTGKFDDYDGLRRNIEFLFNEKNRRGSPLKIWAKMIDFNFTKEELEKFGRDFGDITDEILLTGTGVWTNEMGIDFNLGVKPEKGYDGEMPSKKDRVVCPYTFYNIAINFDGSTGGCMLDWAHSLVAGNVREHSLVEIWNSAEFNRIRRMHLEGRRGEFRSCKGCQCVQFMPEDSELDPERERLLKLF
jgi:radical SAM protein with 4Fe4S-binding SPASM domain